MANKKSHRKVQPKTESFSAESVLTPAEQAMEQYKDLRSTFNMKSILSTGQEADLPKPESARALGEGARQQGLWDMYSSLRDIERPKREPSSPSQNQGNLNSDYEIR
jgi:hypothetical protein